MRSFIDMKPMIGFFVFSACGSTFHYVTDIVFNKHFTILILKVNYNDGGVVDARENMDSTWQENLSDYNSDFSAPSGN